MKNLLLKRFRKLPVFPKSKKPAGHLPGDPIYAGEEKMEPVVMDIMAYNDDKYTEKIIGSLEECEQFLDKKSVLWLNVTGVHDPDVVKKVGEYFHLHPLILEDIMHTTQRPKVEDLDDYIYLVVKMIFMEEDSGEMHSEQLSIILGDHFVITFQEKGGDVFNVLRDRIRTKKGKIRKTGSDYLLYSLIDLVVDHYFGILEKIGMDLEMIEASLVEALNTEQLSSMHVLRREVIFLRKNIWPLREIINSLHKDEFTLILKPTRIYLRDIYDHVIQLIDSIESLRDLGASILDLYLSTVNNKMNEIMKVLTIFTAIFIPLTFLAGVYGMNFRHMPEIEWKWSYPLFWLGIVTIISLMLYVFKRNKWM